jgi:tetratricopeptide (TPR) repeat protein
MLFGGVVAAVLTAPQPGVGPALDRAEAMIGKEQSREAIALLNERVYPWIEKGEGVGEAERGRYHLLIARGIWQGQRALGIELEANRASIVREYLAAERAGVTLPARDLYQLAETYATQGEEELALARAGGLPESAREMRDRVYRRLVDRWLVAPVPQHDRALDLLTRMLTDPALSDSERIWALARRAEVQIAEGFADEAVTRLLRSLPRLEGDEPERVVDLYVQLGRGYLATGAPGEARGQFERVLSLVGDADPRRAWALAHLGRALAELGEHEGAREKFLEVVTRHEGSAAWAAGQLGVAETEATLRNWPAALEAYGALVAEVSDRSEVREPRREEIAQSLVTAYADLMTTRDYEGALRAASLAEQVFDGARKGSGGEGGGEVPSEVVLALATAHRAVADSVLGGEGEAVERLGRLEPALRAEAQRHLIAAGARYREHADRFVLTDNEVYERSLWEAADLFDRAGDQRSAAEAFGAYAAQSTSGPRWAESRYRLGRVHQALGEFDLAAAQYEGLIGDARDRGEAAVGPFAVLSHVPLAQAYLSDQDGENDAAAERLLTEAVEGKLGDTTTRQFRDGLVELATLYYNTGRYERSVERFGEAIARYAEDEERASMVFMLADSRRLLAREIERSLTGAMPEAERREREEMIVEHRRQALVGFEEARAALEGRNASMLTALDRVQLRNSYFYLGDCAFDLGDFEGAIRHYDAARERFAADPASLLAMVQIVNAHVEMGDLRRARTAHERARRFFASLPESVWDDPTLPMGRRDWERWLESSARLHASAGGA